MADSKTYLNVPFAEKDAAKALGARWDAANKKWYVPGDKDITLFAQWQLQSGTMEPASTTREQTSAAALSRQKQFSSHSCRHGGNHPSGR